MTALVSVETNVGTAKYVLRAFDAAMDTALVMDSWMRNLHRHEPWRAMNWTTFGVLLRPAIERVLPATVVAHAVDMPDEIFGWLCGEDRTLYFCYTKEPFRRHKIATNLFRCALPSASGFCFMTPAMRHLAPKWRIVHDRHAQDRFLNGGNDYSHANE